MGNQQNTPGMKCPQCGKIIQTSIAELLSAPSIHCQYCGLELRINREESKKAMDLMRKVQEAEQNLDKASHFNR